MNFFGVAASLGAMHFSDQNHSARPTFEIAGQPRWPKTIGLIRRNGIRLVMFIVRTARCLDVARLAECAFALIEH